MATFAERLKSLRREKGWSQQRLADELDLSKSSVNMYERGEREPGFETMEAIADLFNVDMNYLYGRTDIKIADPIVLAPKKPTIPPGFEPMPKMKHLHAAQTVAALPSSPLAGRLSPCAERSLSLYPMICLLSSPVLHPARFSGQKFRSKSLCRPFSA